MERGTDVCCVRAARLCVCCKYVCVLWSSLHDREVDEVDESRLTIRRELIAVVLDWSTSLPAATTGTRADGCEGVMDGVGVMAIGEGGVNGVLSSMGAAGTDESSRT